MTEAELQAAIIEMAGYLGIKVYHTHDSRRSQPGFPDLVLVGRAVEFWELKAGSGRVSDAQRAWIDAIKATGVYAGVFRPMDWDHITHRLQELQPR